MDTTPMQLRLGSVPLPRLIRKAMPVLAVAILLAGCALESPDETATAASKPARSPAAADGNGRTAEPAGEPAAAGSAADSAEDGNREVSDQGTAADEDELTVPAVPPVVAMPTRRGLDGMQDYIRTELACAISAEETDFDELPTVAASFSCANPSIFVVVVEIVAEELALDLAYDFATLDEMPMSCLLNISAGRWMVVGDGDTERYGEELAAMVEKLDAVVHEDCDVPGLAPDTRQLTATASMVSGSTCEPAPVTPLDAETGHGLSWADFDVSFGCGGPNALVRLPPGTLDGFHQWASETGRCAPYIAAGRWLLYSSAEQLPASTDVIEQLQPLAEEIGGTVTSPCAT